MTHSNRPEGESEHKSFHRKIEGDDLSQHYDTRKLLLGIQRHLLAILFCTLLFAALGSAVTYYYLTNYIAPAILFYKEDLPKTLPGGVTLNNPSLTTALDIIPLEANFQAVIARLGLNLAPKEVEKMISVPRPANNSSLVKIECRSDNAHLAVDIANILAKVVVKRSQDLFSQQLQGELNGLNSQLSQSNARMNKALEEIENFKQEHHYFEMTADYAILIKQLSDARSNLQTANLRYNSLLVEYDNLKQASNAMPEHIEGTLINPRSIPPSSAVTVEELQQQLAASRAKYAPDNPKIKILEDQIKDWQTNDSSDDEDPDNAMGPKKITTINQTKEKLTLELMRMEGKVRSAKKTKEDLALILANLEKQLETLPKDQIAFVKLLKAKEQTEEQVDFLNKSIKTIQLMSNVPTGCFEIYELAEKAKPLKDSITIKLLPLGGMIFGLAMGLLLAFYLEMHDDKIRTLKQIELLYHLPALLYMPEFSFFNKKNGLEKTLYFMRLLSERLEMIQARLPKTSSPLTISMMSSVAHEGKSCLSYFLAVYYQKIGKKVLLIELDSAYNPYNTNHTYIPLERYLEGTAPLSSLICFESVDRIRVAKTQTLMKESVKSPKMTEFMEELKKSYQVIIMDLPGIIETDYTTNLALLCDIHLFIIGSSIVNKKLVDESLRDLFLAGIKPSGIILNRVLPIYIEDVRIKLELEKTKSSLWRKLLRI